MGTVSLHHDGFDMLSLQEVGGGVPAAKDDGSLEEIDAKPEFIDLQDYYIFGTSSVDARLGIVILLDRHCVDKIHKTFHGRRFAAVLTTDKGGDEVLYVSVHLPHKDCPEEDFLMACDELGWLFHRYSQASIVVGGDFNWKWNTSGDNRGASLQAALSHYGVACRCPQVATWHGRRNQRTYDYFLFSRRMQSSWVDLDYGDETLVVEGARQAMQSDHELVSFNVLVKACAKKAFQGEGFFSRRRVCRRWEVSPASVQNSAQRCKGNFFGLSLPQQWEQLTSMTRKVSFPKHTCKNVDPTHVKDLCRQRRALPQVKRDSS